MSLLLLSLLLLQDDSALKVFQKLEETVEKAPRLKLEYQEEGTCTKGGKVTIRWTEKGVIAIAGGTKIHARSSGKFIENEKEEQRDCLIVGDGTRNLLESWGRRRQEVEPKYFSVTHIQGSLVRAGASDALFVAGSFGDLLHVGGGGPQPKEFFEVAELRAGEPTPRGKTLLLAHRYELERFPTSVRKFAQVTLEYDPATWKLLSRESRVRFDGGETKTRDTYTLSFDADLPDSLFKLPADSK